jgi:hypothetical protein
MKSFKNSTRKLLINIASIYVLLLMSCIRLIALEPSSSVSYKRYVAETGSAAIILTMMTEDSISYGQFFRIERCYSTLYRFNFVERLGDSISFFSTTIPTSNSFNEFGLLFKGAYSKNGELIGDFFGYTKEESAKVVFREDYDSAAYISFFKLDTLIGNKAADSCVQIKFIYPQISSYSGLETRKSTSSISSEVRNTINEFIKKYFLDKNIIIYGDTNQYYKDIYGKVGEIVDLWKTDMDAIRHNSLIDSSFAGMPKSYYFDYKINIENNAQKVIGFSLTQYTYAGGAHGVTYTTYVNFDTQSGKQLKLKDFITDEGMIILNKIGEIKFRQNFGLAPNADLKKEGFIFPKNEFALNKNFIITPNGAKFLFNPYEVAAGALGAIEIEFSYNDIKNFLVRDDLFWNCRQ